MQMSLAVFVIFMLFLSTALQIESLSTLSPCPNQCGSTAINYPFGVDDGCGAPHYRKMLNCSGDLFFQTPSGNYKVKSIDYDKQTMTIYDPSMSTCTMLQPHHDFKMSDIQSVVIPPTSDTIFVLLNCSIDSPVLNHYRSLCFNFSGHSCDELYNTCTSYRVFHIGLGGYPPCCFTGYNTVKYMSMNILDCSHYTTVYNTDDLKGIGPLDWTYGIKMSYSVPNSGCERCQRSGGTCGYDTETEMMLCLCSGASNSTRECAGRGGSNSSITDGESKLSPMILFSVLVLVVTLWKQC